MNAAFLLIDESIHATEIASYASKQAAPAIAWLAAQVSARTAIEMQSAASGIMERMA